MRTEQPRQVPIVAAIATALVFSLSSCQPSGAPAAGTPLVASAEIEGTGAGSMLKGKATFTEAAGAVQVAIELEGAPPGKHAVHLHEHGNCGEGGMSAGGHFDPMKKKHGAPNDPERHAGDFGNLEIGADGKGRLALSTSYLSVQPGPNCVVGRGIIVHEKEDDFAPPSGNAGGRIGCGVVTLAK